MISAVSPILTSVESLRERIGARSKEVAEAQMRQCHFCRTGKPDFEKSVVLVGKKEPHRTEDFNTMTIHYLIRHAIVRRCARCARHHEFIRKVGRAAVLSSSGAIIATVLWLESSLPEWERGSLNSGIFWGMSVVTLVVARYFGISKLKYIYGGPFLLIAWGARSITAGATTPPGIRSFGEYKESEGVNSLKSEHYSITANWASNAIASIKK